MGSILVVFKGPMDNLHLLIDLVTTKAYEVHIRTGGPYASKSL